MVNKKYAKVAHPPLQYIVLSGAILLVVLHKEYIAELINSLSETIPDDIAENRCNNENPLHPLWLKRKIKMKM